MLELIAQVDSMSLPLWAVLAFSAAMYPLGFMLGAPCSECCQVCGPCSYCTTNRLGPFACQIFSSISVGDLEATQFNEDDSDCLDGILPLGVSQSYGIIYFSTEPPCEVLETSSDPLQEVEVTLELWDFDMGGDLDSCGCGYLSVGSPVRIKFNAVDAEWFVYLRTDPVLHDVTACDQTITATLVPDFVDGLIAESCHQTLLEWAEGFIADNSLSVTFVTKPCDCGACCSLGDGCVENTTEFYCESETLGLSGSWQGVGTDCDPDPC